MESLPDDPAARRDWLESWAAEQRGGRLRPVSSRIRLARAKARRQFVRAIRSQLILDSRRVANRILDRGLDTSGVAILPEHHHPDRMPYQASSWHVLPRALHYLGVSGHDTFVDFGCGKGRVVHQAARRPFRRVIGVEISPTLAESARKGLAARSHQHRCPNVEIVVSDVTQFPVPDDLTIGFLFHPFANEILEAVLRNIVASIDRHPRRVRLIYVRPLHASQVLATERFRLVKRQLGNSLLETGPFSTAIFESH
jgi:SAM-dependent methyltransferase